jgi:anti-sigma factor RsiW
MTCSEFVAHFSEFYDGTAPEDFARRAEDHLATCPTCCRYQEVVERGAKLLRRLPAPDLPEDFRPRLQHRIFHVDDPVVPGGPTSSVSTIMAVVGMAVLLAAVAWSPALRPRVPVVDLPPIVVSRPPALLRVTPVRAFPFGSGIPAGWAAEIRQWEDLWGDANWLLFEYSPLSQRYRGTPGVQRVGLDSDR